MSANRNNWAKGIAILMAMLLLLLVLAVVLFFSGSMEMFPTEEQDEAMRITAVMVALPLLAAEIGLFFLRRRLLRH